MLSVKFELDKSEVIQSQELLDCLKDDKIALKQINSFNNIIEASNATSVCRHTIGRYCSGKSKTGGGFVWKRE